MGNKFPEPGMVLSHILVVKDLEQSKKFYQDILGAELQVEYGGTSCVFNFMGAWLLVVTGGDATADKPDISFAPPDSLQRVSHSITIRVSDCRGAYQILKERGAQFITPPYDWEFELRCFFRDPDGHLLEISEYKGG